MVLCIINQVIMHNKELKNSTRRPRNRKATKAQFISAVHAAFNTEMYEPPTLSVVSQFTNYNKGLIYRYFGSFNGLVRAYIQSLAEELATEFSSSLNAHAASEDIVQRAILRVVDKFSQRKGFQRIVRWEIANGKYYFLPACISKIKAQIRDQRDLSQKMSDTLTVVFSGLYFLALSHDGRASCGLDMTLKVDQLRTRKIVKDILQTVPGF